MMGVGGKKVGMDRSLVSECQARVGRDGTRGLGWVVSGGARVK